MANTLIVRHSQIGDVLLLLPIVSSLAEKYPNDTFTILTNPKFAPLFKYMPANIILHPMVYRKKKGVFRGINYIVKRYLFVAKFSFFKRFDNVVILQDGSFEDQLCKFFAFRGMKIARINLKEFLRRDRLMEGIVPNMPTLTQLMKSTFGELGYKGLSAKFNYTPFKRDRADALFVENGLLSDTKLVGFAPFSRIGPKVYPLKRMEEVIAHFSGMNNVQVFILGFGEDEEKQAEYWRNKYPSLVSLIGKLSLEEELCIIANSELVVSMDSANLHLASLVNTPVISIWGPSHPAYGYYPETQKMENAIVRNIPCQPCSFFGENGCSNPRQFECFEIDSSLIIDKISFLI